MNAIEKAMRPFLVPGDTIEVPGHFIRRTFWQWLRREPRKPRIFIVAATDCDILEIRPIK